MRNNFEHFDERLEKWWAERLSHLSLDKMIGSPDSIVGLDDLDRFRVYDPTSGNLIFWGQDFHVPSIVGEAVRIGPIAAREADRWPVRP